jgi:AcrR family transcriptional regulator
MYHIKNDKRCIKSAARIGEALRELLTEKPLSEITVTDIQKRSGTGRSTFYRLFDNTDDVLLYLVEGEFLDMVNDYREMDWTDFTEHLIRSIMSESRVILNVTSSGKMHVISRALRNNLTQVAEADSYKFDNLSIYMIAVFIGGCISLVTTWDETGREESVDELARMMRKAFDYKAIEEILTRPAKQERKGDGRQ